MALWPWYPGGIRRNLGDSAGVGGADRASGIAQMPGGAIYHPVSGRQRIGKKKTEEPEVPG